MIELILISVYLLSVIFAWRYIKLVYSKNGIWYTLEPSLAEILFMFFPIINSLFCLYGWILHYPIVKTQNKKDYSKFFNIKK